MSGPTIDATAKVVDKPLSKAGRIFGGDDSAITKKLPENVPATPVPIIARPAIKVALLGASALQWYQ
jgi:hypothetical protein